MTDTLRIYFAHPVTDYGTAREAAAVRLLSRLGWRVENPNRPHHAEGYAARGMDYFAEVVAGCDALAFQRFPCGALGAGVAKEAAVALDLGRMVFEVEGDRLRHHTGPLRGALTVDQTRALIRAIRAGEA